VHIIPHEVWVTLTPAAQALIADAPLLLAEVKRLRENLKRIRHTVFYDIEENFTDEQAYDPVLIEIMEKMKAVL